MDTLAADHNLSLLDRGLGYLTGDHSIDTPLLKRYRIRAQAPWDFGEISRQLAALDLGRIDFKARGVAVDLRAIHQRIKGRGKRRGLVVLTRIAGKKQALICTY